MCTPFRSTKASAASSEAPPPVSGREANRRCPNIILGVLECAFGGHAPAGCPRRRGRHLAKCFARDSQPPLGNVLPGWAERSAGSLAERRRRPSQPHAALVLTP